MAKNDNQTIGKFKVPNEGKNLINKMENDNFDLSNNYDSNNHNNFLNEKSNKKESSYKTNKPNTMSVSERSPSISTKSKGKNMIISSQELKSEINNFNNDLNSDLTKKKKKDVTLTSSFVFYKENKFISNFKKLYSLKQKYISIILLIYSILLFLISIFDLIRNIQKKLHNFLLCNSIIFVLEMVCSGLIILFHIIYYFINIGNNYITFLIMSIIILLFSLIYIFIFTKKKVRFFEIIFHMVYNLLMVIINLIYLFLNYYLIKENTKVQKNIDDIMNFSLRNEPIPKIPKEKNKEHKKNAVLVEEDK